MVYHIRPSHFCYYQTLSNDFSPKKKLTTEAQVIEGIFSQLFVLQICSSLLFQQRLIKTDGLITIFFIVYILKLYL